MRPAWFLLLTIWASDVILSTHALSIVPNGLRHSLRKRETSPPEQKIKVNDLHVVSRIEYRFATTSITSRIANAANVSQEVSFNVVIPETAFISGFKMEVDNKVYEAYVRDKSAAKREYTEAVAGGQTAAHVAASARDSNRFTVSVNVEPSMKVNFNLTYDELLTRRMGTYNLAINLDPGQLVRDMTVDVYIKENRNISVLRVPELRTGNEVDADETTRGNSLATIVRASPTQAHVSFTPTSEQQKSLGHIGDQLISLEEKPLKGQFVVQYDVDRDKDGEVLMNDGYFVHFFAPKDLTPLHKHAIFVLDVSGSMHYRKLDQLKEAMVTILDSLNEGDYFNIIEFSDYVTVWDLDSIPENGILGRSSRHFMDTTWDADELTIPPAYPVTPSYIEKAKRNIAHMHTDASTNIHDALKVALKVAHRFLQNSAGLPNDEATRAPTVFFLTDGRSTGTSTDQILATVKERNRNPAVAIFSPAFGDDADHDFLKKLSLRNLGFARKIYEASDAALQLRDFYRQIASPLLANVSFTYQHDKVIAESTTRTKFPILFLGSEIVVAGKLQTEVTAEQDFNNLEVDVVGVSREGKIRRNSFVPYNKSEVATVNHTVTPLEKLWAYLTIKQLLEAQESNDVTPGDTTGLKQRALELALKYSFVTPLTSLIVVKPNVSELVGEESRREKTHSYGHTPMNRHTSVGLRGPPSPSWQSGSYPISSHHQPSGRLGGGGGWRASSKRGPSSSSADMSLMSLSNGGPHNTKPGGHVLSSAVLHDTSPGPQAPATQVVGNISYPAPALVRPEDLEWLNAVTIDQDITLPFGPSGENMTYSLLPGPGTYLVHSNCTSKTGVVGFCQHIMDCPLDVIKQDVQSYANYFCTLDNYAGVCCPSSLAKPLTSTTVTPRPDTSAR